MTDQPTAAAVVRRVVPAPPDEVFAEWVDADALAEFICPAPTRPGIVTCDPRVGGAFRIDMVDDDSVVHVTGRYTQLDRPHRLQFTWSTDYGGGFDSIVTVTLVPHGAADTLMTIEHAELPRRWRDDHQHGWGSIAGQLVRRLAGGGRSAPDGVDG